MKKLFITVLLFALVLSIGSLVQNSNYNFSQRVCNGEEDVIPTPF